MCFTRALSETLIVTVRFSITPIDATPGSRTRQLGLTTHVILDGCRGIELASGAIDHALDEMKRAGAIILKSGDL